MQEQIEKYEEDAQKREKKLKESESLNKQLRNEEQNYMNKWLISDKERQERNLLDSCLLSGKGQKLVNIDEAGDEKRMEKCKTNINFFKLNIIIAMLESILNVEPNAANPESNIFKPYTTNKSIENLEMDSFIKAYETEKKETYVKIEKSQKGITILFS